jgi:hypothetical protein
MQRSFVNYKIGAHVYHTPCLHFTHTIFDFLANFSGFSDIEIRKIQ